MITRKKFKMAEAIYIYICHARYALVEHFAK